MRRCVMLVGWNDPPFGYCTVLHCVQRPGLPGFTQNLETNSDLDVGGSLPRSRTMTHFGTGTASGPVHLNTLIHCISSFLSKSQVEDGRHPGRCIDRIVPYSGCLTFLKTV